MRSSWNLYRFELRQNLRGFLVWFVILGVLIFALMSMFPTFKSSDYLELINAKINAIPKGLGTAFGLNGSVAGVSFQDIVFWFGYMSQYFVIAVIIYAINLGSNIISKENEDKHIDYLATKPIAKSKIVLAKYKVLVTYLLLLSIGLFVVGYFSVLIFNSSHQPFAVNLLRLYAKVFFEYLFFGTLAFVLSAASKRTSKSAFIVVGIFFASFILGVVSQLQDKFSKLLWLSPYFVFQTDSAGYKFATSDYKYMAILFTLSAAMVIVGVWRYANKDLSLS